MPKAKSGVDLSMWKRIVDFKSRALNGWNVELIHRIVELASALTIMSLKWPNVECLDKLIWMENNLGLFTVESSYNLSCVGENSKNIIWKQI